MKNGLSPKMVEEITKTAIQTVIEHLEKEKSRQEKSKRDWRLRNTKLLLKNYRGLVKHCEDFQSDISALDQADALDEFNSEEFAVESIRRSKKRTLAMVKFMQQMILAYKIMCETSSQPEDLRRYEVVQAMYISEKKMTAEQIAKFQKIEVRTVYNDINNACKALSVLIFGVDGIQFY
jgi:DNA-binding CsgD family transcriptional regulator